tara:strand:+ start:2924 stop:3445 length:522 start_codon:yes stop_codon:yes gene_type:complete
MITRNIFKKRKTNKKKLILFFFLSFLLFIMINFFFIKNENVFIVIPENIQNYYIIPHDKGGEKVPNLDKKSLNSISQEIVQNKIEKPENIYFSIQIYVDSELEKVNKFLKKLTISDENIFNIKDFYILVFASELGNEYFLLYKTFSNRLDAKNYCLNFLPKIDNCLVVDTTKF